MTQYLLSVWGSEAEMAKVSPDEVDKLYAQVDVFNSELQASGAWVFAGGLQPAATASVVRADNGEVTTTDGPYSQTTEPMGGFWVIEAPNLEAALALARKAAVACAGPVEVRPFQEEPEA